MELSNQERAAKLNRARVGMTVWRRADETSEWKPQMFASVSIAKADNGVNSVTLKSPTLLPGFKAN